MSSYDMKSSPCEFKVDTEKRTISGHASIFGNIDNDSDITEKGSFQKTIAERFPHNLIKFLWQHRDPLGPLLKISEDSVGLAFEGKVSKTALGNDALILMADGVVDRMSFGFTVADYTIDPELKGRHGQPVRRVKRYDPLYEVSPVTFAANELATISTIKGLLPQLGEGNKNLDLFIEQVQALKALHADFIAAREPISTPAEIKQEEKAEVVNEVPPQEEKNLLVVDFAGWAGDRLLDLKAALEK
tara:strand:+ start:1298 stop:2032 length:735 start_codon:yes stop_codon:yes gene_type:complete